MANGSPRPAFFWAVLVVVLGLVGLGLWRFGALPGTKTADIDTTQMATGTEAPDSAGITTAKEYNYVPAAKLPPVQGISSYKPWPIAPCVLRSTCGRAGLPLFSRTTASRRERFGRRPTAKTSKSS